MPSQLEDEVAQRLATSLRLPNANQLLAQRVIALSRSLPTDKAFVNAARAFGRFDEEFLVGLRSFISSHADQSSGTSSNGARFDAPASSTHTRQPERAGLATLGGEKHVFRSNKPKSSLSGAAAKRADTRDAPPSHPSDADHSAKRPRISSTQLSHLDEEPDTPASKATIPPVFKAPARPASHAQAQARPRGSETPSHPGGLTETAARRLEEHRRKRAMAAESSAKAKQAASSSTASSSTASAASSSRIADARSDPRQPHGRNQDSERYRRDNARDHRNGRTQHPDTAPPNHFDRRTWDSTPRNLPNRDDARDRWTPRMSNTPGSSRRSDGSLASTRSAGSRRWDETPSRRARSPCRQTLMTTPKVKTRTGTRTTASWIASGTTWKRAA
ncbi:hypothetical protein L1887_59778 [Cichorium endivia]|nr:hypothetical protein L1887_59778 [Cichorium endivia]